MTYVALFSIQHYSILMNSSLIAQITINETVIPFFFALSFISANRLMINIRIKYWQHEVTDTDFSLHMPEFRVPDPQGRGRARVAPTSSELRYGLQLGDLDSLDIDIEMGEAGPSNYQERASSTQVSVPEDPMTYPPPIHEPDADAEEETAEDKAKKAEDEENRN